MRPMRWVRDWVEEQLDENSHWRNHDLEARGLFKCLVVLAGKSNNKGEISIPGLPGVPYTEQQLCAALKISADDYRRAMAKLEADMVTTEENGCLQIANWSDHQTEYDRQKGYREKLQGKVTSKGYTPEDRRQKSEDQKLDAEEDSAPVGAGDSQANPPDGEKPDGQAEPGKPKRKRPAKSAVSGADLTECYECYARCYEEHYREKYVHGGAKDAKNLKAKLLALGYKAKPDGAVEDFCQRVTWASRIAKENSEALVPDKWLTFPTNLAVLCSRLADYTQANHEQAKHRFDGQREARKNMNRMRPQEESSSNEPTTMTFEEMRRRGIKPWWREGKDKVQQ